MIASVVKATNRNGGSENVDETNDGIIIEGQSASAAKGGARPSAWTKEQDVEDERTENQTNRKREKGKRVEYSSV